MCLAIANSACTTSSTQASGFLKEFTLNTLTGTTRSINDIQVGKTSGDYFLLLNDNSSKHARARYNRTDGTYTYSKSTSTLASANVLLLASDESGMMSFNSVAASGAFVFTPSDGAFVNHKYTTSYTPVSAEYFRASLAPSNNVYFMTVKQSTNLCIIKHVQADSNMIPYQLTNIPSISEYVTLAAITDDKVFISHTNSDSPKKIVARVYDFNGLTITWSKTMSCPASADCSMYYSEAIFSGSSIYNVIGVQDVAMLTVFATADGAVSLRKQFAGTSSSTSIAVLDFDMNGNKYYILAQKVGTDAGYYFINYDSSADTIKSFSYNVLSSCTPHKLVYNSFTSKIAIGTKACATHQFHTVSPEYAQISPAFEISSLFTVATVSDSDYTLASEASASITTATATTATAPFAVTTNTFTNVTTNEFLDTINIYVTQITQSYAESLISQVLPIVMTCSSASNITVAYSIEDHNGDTKPAWATLDSGAETITFDTPAVSTNTDFEFAVRATFGGSSTSYIDTPYKVTVTVTSGGGDNGGGDNGGGDNGSGDNGDGDANNSSGNSEMD